MSAPALQPDTVPHSERLLLDTQSAAEMLSISPKTLQRLPIPRIKIPNVKRVLWRRSDLDLYVRHLAADIPSQEQHG